MTDARGRWLVVASALCLAVQSPALAQSSDYRRAVAARLAGETKLATDLLARIVAAEPANADARLQYGLALLAAGRLDEAQQAFNATLHIAPGYEDARIGLARVHLRRGDRGAALDELNRVSANNAEAAELRAALVSSPTPAAAYGSRIDLDASYSDVRNQRDWQDMSVRFTHSLNPSTRVAAAIEHARRFSRRDTLGEVRVDHRLSRRISAWIATGATPGADFLPRWQVAGGGAVKLSQGPAATVATLDARHSRYRTGTIRMFNPGVEQYLPGGHWLTARMINVIEDGDWASGWLARADVAATSRLRLFAGMADAPDVTEGVVVRSSACSAGCPRTSMRAPRCGCLSTASGGTWAPTGWKSAPGSACVFEEPGDAVAGVAGHCGAFAAGHGLAHCHPDCRHSSRSAPGG